VEDDVSHGSWKRGLVLVAVSAFACGAFAVGLAGCAGAQEPKNDLPFELKPADTSAMAESKPDDKEKEKESTAKKDEDLTDAQREQMEIALRRGGDKAANCDKVVPGSPTGEGEVKVTFDGKKGRAVDVTVGPPWAGTDAESCIKRAFIGEIVVPFDGSLEVPYTVKVGVKAAAADKGKKATPTKKKKP
jgi:hypothetical protein